MSTSPYVGLRKPMSSRHDDRSLWRAVIGEREFDGIDHPNYTQKYSLTADEARYIATELWKIAEQIDGKTKKDSTLKKVRANTARIIKEARKEFD